MTTLDQRLAQIIINLKVIAKLESDQRLLFKNRVVGIRNHYPIITPMIRSLAGESREDVVNGLTDLLEDLTRVINDYLNLPELQNPNVSNYDRETALPIVKSLIQLKIQLPHIYDDPDKGLNAAKIMYSEDPIPSSQIEKLIDNFKESARKVHLEIDKINKKFDLNGTPQDPQISQKV